MRTPLSDKQISEFVCQDQTRLPIEINISKRAKKLRVELSHQGLLKLVFPQGSNCDAQAINKVICQHRDWIERAAYRTKAQRQAYQASRAMGLPTQIRFPALGELWLLDYVATASKQVRVKPQEKPHWQSGAIYQEQALTLSGNIDDVELCRKALERFLSKRAKETLPMCALVTLRDLGFSAKKMPVICNRKRAWGACNAAGQISLDKKLLFLPKNLVMQVILHEIAHLKHLNHSRKFYNELYSYPGASKANELELKEASQFVPAWAMGAL